MLDNANYLNNPNLSMTTIAMIMAAGSGSRFDLVSPKQYFALRNNITILRAAIEKFVNHPHINGGVMVVINESDLDLYQKEIARLDLLPYAVGGKTRQESVRLGLIALQKYHPDKVLIHDAARPNVSMNLISKVVKALDTTSAVDVGLPIFDSIKNRANMANQIDRTQHYLTQTPQGFNYQTILELHLKATPSSDYTDDIQLAIHDGLAIHTVKGEKNNFKITTKEDLQLAQLIYSQQQASPKFRIGNGFDVHKFVASKDKNYVPICGVNVPSPFEVIAHSDGDVGLHALMDAILGALSKGDIGTHFPPNDSKWKNADSKELLKIIKELVDQEHTTIENIDITIICQKPIISPFRNNMIKTIAEILEIDINQVSVKATTTEKLGFLGRQEGIAAQAVCLLKM